MYNKEYIFVGDNLIFTTDLNNFLKVHPELKNRIYSCEESRIDIEGQLDNIVCIYDDVDEDIFFDERYANIVFELNNLINEYCSCEYEPGRKVEVEEICLQ